MIAALIVAAGQGRRMGAARPKQYLPLASKPILSHTLQSFNRCDAVTGLFLVTPESDLSYCKNEIVGSAHIQKPVTVIAGGARRQDSVLNGLNAINAQDGIVMIHDGVRPFISTELINACIAGAKQYGACIPAIPVVDTLKQADAQHRIQATIPREHLYMAQTPQAFHLSVIKKAHTEAQRQGWEVTDDASMVEQLGEPVHIVKGTRENIKITTPEDLTWAESYLKIKAL